eukprot:TRINITY_DN9398_c0_g1_i1.p1 TRINITY_DN9398_c0_g1~~TRINITY_DN9398_c0_g1_i1.p1  ORF type:complete len:150 (-),score=29.20 TRINITY_DN9398_c0_g1_i1:203-616(-)
MVGQLAHLLWQAERRGIARYSLCITGDHSTPVEYGDHSFEPVPFTICNLKDFVKAKGGEETVLNFPLDPFSLPIANSDQDDKIFAEYSANDEKIEELKFLCGDRVTKFDEISAARGCLGRFQGSEMMGIIKKYLQLT